MTDAIVRLTQAGECQRSGHDWATTGIHDHGAVLVPCRRDGCEAGARHLGGYWTLEAHAFPNAVNGIALDIADDPLGGVAKIVKREVATSYDLDTVPLARGDVVIDIGAHVGIVSIYLAKRYPGIRVYAFEPVPGNYARLLRNIAANEAEGITALNLAVTYDGRDLTLAGDPHANSGGISAYTNAEPRFTVKSTTLPAILVDYSIERCKLLKIDCEGAEHEILGHGAGTLDRIDYLRGEFHWNNYFTVVDVQHLADHCARHIEPGHIKVIACRMGD